MLFHVFCYHDVAELIGRAINALGYRSKLLEQGVIELSEVELSRDESEIMERILKASRAEMSKADSKLGFVHPLVGGMGS